jgi:hypothetical protein
LRTAGYRIASLQFRRSLQTTFVNTQEFMSSPATNFLASASA